MSKCRNVEISKCLNTPPAPLHPFSHFPLQPISPFSSPFLPFHPFISPSSPFSIESPSFEYLRDHSFVFHPRRNLIKLSPACKPDFKSIAQAGIKRIKSQSGGRAGDFNR